MRLDQAEQILESQVGSVLLALLELVERRDVDRLHWGGHCDLTAVEAAIRSGNDLEYTDLLKHILLAVEVTSPWNPDGEDEVAVMRSCASDRLPIAELLMNRFANRLASDCEFELQEMWLNPTQHERYLRSKYFVEHRNIYAQGQFTWAGMWSTTTSAPKITEWIISGIGTSEEIDCYKPVVADGARVYEIHSFGDWAKLVIDNKLNALPGILAPDWTAIARKYDAVHLSWMGLLLGHDNSTLANDWKVIPLKYWNYERTLWLNDCFSELVELK